MPRKYKRKEGVQSRVCSWTAENLQSAFNEMDKKNYGGKRNIPTNALPDTTFVISDTALSDGNPSTSRAPDQVLERTSTIPPQIPNSLDCQTELANVSENIVCLLESKNQKENISEHELNKTPPNLIRTSINRESPILLTDPEFLDDISIVDIGDSTIAEILEIDIEQETPSKILIEASPIPKNPLTMAKRAKQSADILNSKENIKRKKDVVEKKEKQIKTKLDKKNKTETTKELKKPKKRHANKKQDNENKKENNTKQFFLVKLCQERASLKRQIIYSSSNEDEDNPPNYKNKGKNPSPPILKVCP